MVDLQDIRAWASTRGVTTCVESRRYYRVDASERSAIDWTTRCTEPRSPTESVLISAAPMLQRMTFRVCYGGVSQAPLPISEAPTPLIITLAPAAAFIVAIGGRSRDHDNLAHQHACHSSPPCCIQCIKIDSRLHLPQLQF